MAARDPATRQLVARIGAAALYANGADPKQQTAAARAGQWARFEKQVDPDGVLDPAERNRRAAHARRQHMLTLALKSAQARKSRLARQSERAGSP